jgi:multidrug resistance efflux pump
MSSIVQEKRVPLAWQVRWRRIRSQLIPVLAFALSVAGSGWLWQWHGASVQGVGEVDGMRVNITSPTSGLVVELPHETGGQWTVFDHVRAGDIIARIEDQQVEASKSALRREITALIDQVNQLQVDGAGADTAAVEAVGRAREYELSHLELLNDLLSGERGSESSGISEDTSTAPELPEALPTETRDTLVRLREARRGLASRSEELSQRIGVYEIPSPISGTLVNVYCSPGQVVHPGGLIATIAADHGQHIVGFIPEESTIAPKVGMQVTMRARIAKSQRITSEVEEVGKQIEPVPSHQRAIANTPQWGLPVRIKLPSDAGLRPGALLDIVFHSAEVQ